MKNIAILSLALSIAAISPALTSAKDVKQMTGLELQAVQARDFDVPKDITFAAVMSVLQDAGYRIGSADRDTGLITGTASTSGTWSYSLWSGMGKKKKTPIVSAFVEQRGTGSKVRLNFVLAKVKSTIYGSGAADEEPILDPTVYQQAFEKINQAVFVRQAIDAPTPALAPAAPAATPSDPAISPAPAAAPKVN
jgi:hypothetical protein